MMKLIQLLPASLLAMTILSSCNNNLQNSEYYRQLIEYREVKNREFSDPELSPLKKEQIDAFEGLEYFEPDSTYRIKAALVPFSKQDTFEMITTTERRPEYIRYAEARFKLHGQDLKLEVYRNLELLRQPEYRDYAFIPFTDQTSGKESYGGGRYLDLQLPGEDSLTIDFNYAYNPYCAYNSDYSCPVPPRVNHLEVPIRAGEKVFHH